jgi:prepilin-type processing-associated H-X9-DG protein
MHDNLVESRMINHSSRRGRDVRTGVTLVELMSVVALAGVLTAILLPSLTGARRSARTAACLSNISQSVHDTTHYAAAWRDRMPALRRATRSQMAWREPRGIVYCGSGWTDSPYFGDGRWWSRVLAAHVGESSEAWTCPQTGAVAGEVREFGSPRMWRFCGELQVIPSSYSYSLAFVASPEFWRTRAGQNLQSLGAQQLSSVAFPSQKVVLFEKITVHLRRIAEPTWDLNPPRGPVAFADGHVATKDFSSARPGVTNRYQPFVRPPMLNTKDGVLGIDYD